ncbi:hypothetical protein GCM10027589_21950 [Actinocorallia lasiicapitis]
MGARYHGVAGDAYSWAMSGGKGFAVVFGGMMLVMALLWGAAWLVA